MQSDGLDQEEKNDKYFRCEICNIWFNDIDEFFLHILDEHHHIKISDDVQDILYKQWEKILKMEKTIMELVSKKRFKSAKRHLKSSLITLNGIITNVFSINDNIFKYFISTMRPRIKSLIKSAKLINSDDSKRINAGFFEKKVHIKKYNGSTIKLKLTKGKNMYFSNTEGRTSQGDSDFSSDDDLCLKEAIKKVKKDSTTEESENVNNDCCLKKNTYYVIPERVNGTILSILEKDQIRTGLKDVLRKKNIDLSSFNNFYFKRFDLELDEVVPEDAFIINEWLIGDSKKDDWEKISFADFVCKNISKRHKKSKSNSFCNENNLLSDKTTSDELNSVDDSNIIDNVKYQHENMNIDENSCKKCEICHSAFSSENYLKVHLINVHHISDVRCDLCGEIFLYQSELFQHHSQYHSVNLECEVCLNRFTSIEEKEKHFLSHESKSWCCGVCSEKFLSGLELKGHYKICHITKKFTLFTNINEKSNEEPKTSNRVVKYDKNSMDAPECDRCFRRFTSIGRLTQHIAIAHEGKMFVRKKKHKIDDCVVSEHSTTLSISNTN